MKGFALALVAILQGVELSAAAEPLVLNGHYDGMLSAACSPCGTRLAPAGPDKTVRV